MDTFSMTDMGLLRNSNQDSVFCEENPIGRFPNLFLVADGMGGHKAGDLASRLCIAEMVKQIQSSTARTPVSAFEQAIEAANQKVYQCAKEDFDLAGMGTTVVGAMVEDDVAYIANIGDSRFYRLHEHLEQITVDHSLVEEMVQSGEIQKEEMRTHPNKNIITRALGTDDTVRPDCFEVKVEPGDVLLLCSDGLTNMVEDSQIEKIVKEYDYEPNVLAANLKANKTHTVGIVCPTLTSYASSRMMMNIDQFLKKHHYTTIIINTNHDELDEIKSITKLIQLRVDGIILLATSITMAHRDIASKSSVPIVFMAQAYDDGVSVINNDYEAGYKIGEYIYSNGHKNVVYAGVNRKDVAVGVIRRQGVYDGLQDVHPHFLETDFSAEKTMDKLNDYLKNHTCPTAIICATDTIAMGCMKVLKDHGLRIPEDVSVTGFGGYWTSTVMSPALTTIKFHYAHAGQMAGQIILDMIEEKEVERATLIDFTFIEGESVRSI